MAIPQVNYLAVLVSGIVIFLLGGLWYSPLLFAKPWVRLMGKSVEELKAGAGGPLPYILVFFCGLVTALILAMVLNHFRPLNPLRGALVGTLCWLGFAAPSSFGTAVFSSTPRPLWLINTVYNLVAFAAAGVILSVWQ